MTGTRPEAKSESASESGNALADASGREPLLRVAGLRTHFTTSAGVIKAVDGIDFEIDRGEVLGLVGESGCGKSVTALSIAGLLETGGRVVDGSIRLEGTELVGAPERLLNGIRGRRIAMIFQQPAASLDPVMSIGRHLWQALRNAPNMSRAQRRQRSIDLLAQVQIADPARRVREYPHQLSGGMAQRVMIAIALAGEPDLLIADEPTTALDVTVQAQVLDLLRELQASVGMAVILITHDLGVVAEIADRVAVMYAGRIVEQCDASELFDRPLHPYTVGLMGSRPGADTSGPGESKRRLQVIPGGVPVALELPVGCSFVPRCAQRELSGLVECESRLPPVTYPRADHAVRCWLHE